MPEMPPEMHPPRFADLKGGFLEDGRLFIIRGGGTKVMDCRFCTTHVHVAIADNSGAINADEAAKMHRTGYSCSDHCGHMGEPMYQELGPFQGKYLLPLCNGTMLTFIEFKDNRKSALPMMKNGGN